jgi:hypothetical protein
MTPKEKVGMDWIPAKRMTHIPPGSPRRGALSDEYQVRGKVTPRCPWYFPPRSAYEVSQTSSPSKNSIWAQPSPE